MPTYTNEIKKVAGIALATFTAEDVIDYIIGINGYDITISYAYDLNNKERTELFGTPLANLIDLTEMRVKRARGMIDALEIIIGEDNITRRGRLNSAMLPTEYIDRETLNIYAEALRNLGINEIGVIPGREDVCDEDMTFEYGEDFIKKTLMQD